MVRYPLYKGGFIVLPEQAVRALYIIEKAPNLSKLKQIRLLEQALTYDVADSELNEIRINLLKENGIEYPSTLSEVLTLLITAGVIKDNEQGYEINYRNTIETSPLELTKDARETISYIRSFYNNSENMMSYINSFDIVGYVPEESDEAHVILVNELMGEESEPKERAYRAAYVHEVSVIKEQIKQTLQKEEKDEKNFN